ncbi:hypothetical protein CMI37_19880 [Candidatus Pacearchaeota archaeon]|nr:hypothetical protein [Candidatus Pacearchaeota archaeon]|tara:strand:- start:595 stop:1104 length:510 start_codon:yes stop_codon:yes gene_type:complete
MSIENSFKPKEKIIVKAGPIIRVYDGEIKEENLVREIDSREKNLITNNGLKGMMDVLAEVTSGNIIGGPSYIWVGSGATTATNADTDLATYASEKQLTDYVRAGGNYTGTWSVTFGTSESNHEWEEIALANGAHGSGTMWTRYVFTAQKFTKTSSQQAVVEYELTIGRG